MMTDELKLRTLTERFLDGETTQSEEQQLYERYRSGDVPDDLKPLRQMFMDYAALSVVAAEQRNDSIPKPVVGRRRWWLVAAVLLVLLAGGAVTAFHYESADECVAYVYGHRVTDRQQVLAEMRQSMGSLAGSDATDAVDAQLHDLFGSGE